MLAVLAMFDRGLRTLAGDAFLGSLEIVPTRIVAAMLHRHSRYSTHAKVADGRL
jgi:hypothetical protein